jgi:spore maturation protein CgeB
VVEAIDAPIALWGPGWEPAATPRHEVHPGRIAHARVGGLYAGHLAALNIRNERNVLGGLNQRSFDPCLAATAVLGDDQPDLALCFEPGVEALVWREPEELNAHYARLRADPVMARRIGEAGRRRVLADHTYPRRLEALLRAL